MSSATVLEALTGRARRIALGGWVLGCLRRCRTGLRRYLRPPGPLEVRRLKASPKKIAGGEQLVRQLIELCRLRPDDAVLDVGCGSGGPALALTGYLGARGRYEGLDVQPGKVARARRVIGAAHPNFHFRVADVRNRYYNATGKSAAADYRFPFRDGTFDVVFLNSVFTHMPPRDIEHYLAEIARVMRRGGRCLITYFLLNAESERLIAAKAARRASKGAAGQAFPHRFEGYRARDKDVLERAVALDEPFVRGLYAKCGLRIVEPIRYGRWCGRRRAPTPQDIIVAEKR